MASGVGVTPSSLNNETLVAAPGWAAKYRLPSAVTSEKGVEEMPPGLTSIFVTTSDVSTL